ncbi:MAG: LPS export ABC transporter periplasmic protein LptC [Candidatus Obscuribacterales bacterium]|jgi:hypothetical protein
MFDFLKSDWFKLVLALSILGGIVGLLYYAQWSATIEEKKFKEQRDANPTASNIAFTNYELKEVDDANHVRWILNAKTGTLIKDTKDVNLSGISMKFLDGDAVKMQISAPVGRANTETRHVELSSGQGQRVIAEGEEGKSRMEMEKLELEKKNQFKATGGVNIAMGVAKVTGNYATGRFGKKELEDLKIIGNTHAIISSQ